MLERFLTPLGLTAAVALAGPAAAHLHHKVDRTAKPQHGMASYYRPTASGKPTASGAPAAPGALSAASKTLPLGAKASVTNVETGKKVVVTVTDRGPYKKGRIVDVSPRAAEKLGMKQDGVAPVKVQPLTLPTEK